jgi:hypothetical protein
MESMIFMVVDESFKKVTYIDPSSPRLHFLIKNFIKENVGK